MNLDLLESYVFNSTYTATMILLQSRGVTNSDVIDILCSSLHSM
jgi:hypothetical protein